MNHRASGLSIKAKGTVRKMTKSQFVEVLSQKLDQSKEEGERLLDAVLKTVVDALQRGEKVDLRGFGTFKIRETKARQARNPRTGEAVSVPAKKVGTFKPSKELSALLNAHAGPSQIPSEKELGGKASGGASASH
jgi:integration host factor subunit beta